MRSNAFLRRAYESATGRGLSVGIERKRSMTLKPQQIIRSEHAKILSCHTRRQHGRKKLFGGTSTRLAQESSERNKLGDDTHRDQYQPSSGECMMALGSRPAFLVTVGFVVAFLVVAGI